MRLLQAGGVEAARIWQSPQVILNLAFFQQRAGACGAAPAPGRVLDVIGMPFDGPCYTAAELRDVPGVYVVVDVRRDRRGRIWHACIDAGMSERVRSRVSTHDRYGCWIRNVRGSLAFAAMYTDDADFRAVLEEAVRALFGPLCGDRPR